MTTFVNPTKICQIEIGVSDLKKSLEFYKEVFGWQRSPAEIHEFVILEVPENCGFGLSLVETKEVQMATMLRMESSYISIPMIQKRLLKNALPMGKLIFGPKALASYGSVYQIADPDGNRFGLFHKV